MKRSRLERLIKSPANALWGALRLNSFVYNACLRERVRRPDIRVRLVELYGQCGDDIIVAAMLDAKATIRNTSLANERYLEIGGNHPFATSATYLLNRQLGMNGIIVEANPALIADLKKGRPRDVIVHAAVHDSDAGTARLSVSKLSEMSSLDRSMVLWWGDGSVGEAGLIEVPATRINRIVRDHMQNKAPCFMSIDVEGLDLRLLKDFDFERYRPWIVQVEYTDNFQPPGNSKEIIAWMRAAGYTLAARTNANLIFADSDEPAASCNTSSSSKARID
jgi:FkbM family methyltransferase